MKIKTTLQILCVCLGLAALLPPLARASGLKSTGAAALGRMNALEARSAVPTPANLTRQLARPDAAAPWLQSQQRPAELVVGWTAQLNTLSNAVTTIALGGTSVTNVATTNGVTNLPPVSSELKPYDTFLLSVDSDQLADLRIDLISPTPNALIPQGGADAGIPPKFRLYVDGLETSVIKDINPEGMGAYSRTWLVEVRPDSAPRPTRRGKTAGRGQLQDNPDNLTEETAAGDGDWLTLGPGRSIHPGTMDIRWGVHLGRIRNGNSAGKLRLLERGITADTLTPWSLVYSPPTTNELDLVVIYSDGVRQIKAPEAFVDIIATNLAYEIRYYLPTVPSAGTNENGLFTLAEGAVPYVVWRVSGETNPANPSLSLTEVRPSVTYSNQLSYDSTNQIWTLLRGAGAEQRIEQRSILLNEDNTVRWETNTVRGADNAVTYKALEVYRRFAWGWETESITVDPDGTPAVQTYTYYDNPEEDWQYGKLRSVINADGSWEKREYYNEPVVYVDVPPDDFISPNGSYLTPRGALARVLKPFKDSPATPPTNDLSQCLVTGYLYGPPMGWGVGEGIAAGLIQLRRVDSAVGVDPFSDPAGHGVLQQEFTSDGLSGTSYLPNPTLQVRVTRQGQGRNGQGSGFSWTASFLWPIGVDNGLAGKSLRQIYPSQMAETFAYDFGVYNTTNGYTRENGGADFREIKLDHSFGSWGPYSPVMAVDGLPIMESQLLALRSKKTVTVFSKGREVRRDTFLFNGIEDTNVFYEPLESIISQRDSLGHLTNRFRIDPATGAQRVLLTASWKDQNGNDGVAKTSETDEYGSESLYSYDSLKRVITNVRTGVATGQSGGALPDVIAEQQYDSSDNVIWATVSAGGLATTNSFVFDPAKRLITASGTTGTTNYSYTQSGQLLTETYPGGTEKVTEKYLDGRLKSVTGSAVLPECYDYAPQDWNSPVDQGGTDEYARPWPFHLLGTKKSVGDPENPRWSWQWKDRWDRVFYEDYPTVGNGTLLTEHFYDSVQTETESGTYTPGRGSTVYGYDAAQHFAAVTISRFPDAVRNRWSMYAYEDHTDGLVTSASTIRYTNTINTNIKIDDAWFQVSSNLACLQDNDAEKTVLSVQWTRLTGFAAGVVSEVRSWDASGASNVVTVTVDRTAHRTVETHQSNLATNPVTRVTVNGLLITENSPSVPTPAVHIYDGFGREIRTLTPTGITLTNEYHPVTGLLLSRSDLAGNVTQYEYYPADHASAHRLKCEISPGGKRKYCAYDTRGNVTHLWGDVPYPERWVYDAYGDKVELHTFRGGTNWQGSSWPEGSTGTPDITRWTYHAATGLLLEKQDAVGRKVQHQYDVNNLLQVRLWSRTNDTSAIASTNLYNGYGEVIALQYNDGTPPVSFGDFNRQGLPRTITDGSGTHALAYDAVGRLVSDAAGSVGLSNAYSVFGLESRTVAVPGTNSFAQAFGYDPATGRLLTVSQGDISATYAYATNNDVIASVTLRNGGNTVLTTTKGYEFGSRLQTVTHALAAGGTVDGRGYVYDALQRRTRATEADGAYWSYGYDDRSQLTSAKRYWPDDSPMPGQQFEFAYDAIGNRTVTAAGGNQSGQNLRSATWQANELNQLVSRGIPGWLAVSGEAASNALVTVNCETPFRRGEFFHRELGVNNSGGPVWQALTNTAVFAGAGPEGADIVEERRGQVFVPQSAEQPTYDADGNLTTDGRWSYTWDAENRLTSMETRAAVATALGADFPRKKLAFTYDHQGRRASKAVYTWDPQLESYQLSTLTRFLYDGWLLLAELDATQDTEAPLLTQSYLWGLDLSGTFADAGGIGGLLAIAQLSTPQPSTHFACSDANGNVTALVNAGSGQPSARYDYAPFGELLRASGEAAGLNPFRFSTKYADAETGLIYYGYRYYSPSTGKWINRDPLEEEGGRNLYAFVGNNPANLYDVLGLAPNGLADTESAMTTGEGLALAGAGVAGAIILSKTQNLVDACYQGQLFLSDCIDIFDRLSDSTFEALLYSGIAVSDALGETVVFSKQTGKQNDSGLEKMSDAEIQTKAKDPKLSGKERRKYQKEEKARGIRPTSRD